MIVDNEGFLVHVQDEIAVIQDRIADAQARLALLVTHEKAIRDRLGEQIDFNAAAEKFNIAWKAYRQVAQVVTK